MSAAVPSALKAADIARFAQRAGQLEKARPAVAYWCNYWIVDQIISRGLHQADDDSKSYTMQLMDKLEQAKIDFAENDAIVDDMAGQAYVEQFGQETFQRAENTMKANKVSRQTADTFQAAATFLELCQIWGPLDPEIASKIKFAKYHALRIAKAIKAGNDPNMTNPTPEPSPNLEKPSLDNNDPDVRMLNGTSNPSLQPSVEESPEDHSFQQPGPSQGPSPQDENYYHTSAGAEVSPLAPPSDNRAMSEGGGYFPSVPDESTSSVRVGTVPEETTGAEVVTPPLLTHDILHPTPHSLDGIHAASQSTLKHLNMSPSLPPSVSTTDQSQPHGLPKDTTQLNTMQPMPRHPQTAHGHASNPTAIRSLRDDEVSVAAAQKHAKFAISALNFEDVKTAVKELEDALEVLGAR